MALRRGRQGPWPYIQEGLAAPRLWMGVTLGQVELSLFSLTLNGSDAGHLGGTGQGLGIRNVSQGSGRGMASEE